MRDYVVWTASFLWDATIFTKIVLCLFFLYLAFVAFSTPWAALESAKKAALLPPGSPGTGGVSLWTPFDVILLPLLSLSYGIENKSVLFGIAIFLGGVMVYVAAYFLILLISFIIFKVFKLQNKPH